MNDIDFSKIRLVIGLGNPGDRFIGTRHNIGAEKLEMVKAKLAEIPQNIEYLIPSSYMNESGKDVAKQVQKKGLKPEEILVLHDDIDLQPGEIKIKEQGSAGGHNGLRSIIKEIGENNFWRLRIGVGRPFPHKPTTPEEENTISKYVLSKIPPEDQTKIDQAVTTWLETI